MNHMISAVELTYTQLWVISDSVRIGPLPSFLNILPKSYIYDEHEFQQRVLIPLQEMDVLDAKATIHPAVISWLRDICENTEYLNVIFQRGEKELRLTIARIPDYQNRSEENKFVYLWASGGKVRLGVPEIYSVKSLLKFIYGGIDSHQAAQINTFSYPKEILEDMVDKVVKSPKDFSLKDIQQLIDKLAFPSDLIEIMQLADSAVDASIVFLVNRREDDKDIISSKAVSVLDTTRGRILMHPTQKKFGTEIIVYESGNDSNLQQALEELFNSHSCTFWF